MLEKSGFGVLNEDDVNTKVVEVNKTNQMELKHEFLELRKIPHARAKSLKRLPKSLIKSKRAFKTPQSYIKAILTQT